MFFDREIYSKLTDWAQNDSHALYLERPRQVGKTALLQKLCKECFDTCIYIRRSADRKESGVRSQESE